MYWLEFLDQGGGLGCWYTLEFSLIYSEGIGMNLVSYVLKVLVRPLGLEVVPVYFGSQLSDGFHFNKRLSFD